MFRCYAVSVGAVHNDSTVSVVGLEGQSKGCGCHEANYRSCGNGCTLSGLFYSCTEQGFDLKAERLKQEWYKEEFCLQCSSITIWPTFQH